ncbi:MAG TPA: LacI family DNA-binding transcriptional regulator [Leifsonia sp.]|nr:LacI family DNA-binding transcriptional regulator [Leifsonia sp.]
MATKRSPLRATLHDVAREAGVSIATASRALNGSDRVVRPDISARVEEAARRLRYVANVSAQSVKRGATSTIGLVVNNIADPYFAAIASGLITAAKAARMTVTITASEGTPELELRNVRDMRARGHRAIIVAGSRDSGATYGELIDELRVFERSGGSVVMVSQPLLPFPTVAVDNVGGARSLALQLAGHGYRRFAVLSGSPTLLTVAERRAGFAEGLAQVGLSVEERDTFVDDFTRDGGYRAAEQLIARGQGDTDLVFAVNDVMAVGAAAAFRDHGIRVGRDIGVAGFDDIRMARDVTPSLTTVTVPLAEMGRIAFESAMAEPQDDPIRTVSATGVIRESTPRRARRTGHAG